ncbi:MAG TPA: cupin [Gammaproteobacteria bacterium]|nr:cupin [Gammaproteobacteria bacterium]|tara:strand:+ start:22839 stop:24047 length:1209 start_codon:yes stop_codon:yes gene_type:complete
MINLPDNFFEEYWQKKPCLIKAGTEWRPEITPDELAGIACEEEGRARIIRENTEETGAARWQLAEGPFEEKDFATLQESHWTLLVQEVDSWDEQVAELMAMPVIPQWRVQDVMVSYAVDQGSVGPHFDYYDVFLVQGMGKRTWKLGQTCDDNSPRLAHDNLLLLKDMDVYEEHLVEPGDILYIPPGVSHWGISEGECMTFSIGFRAPSAAETMQELVETITPQLNDNERYKDSDALIQYHQQQDFNNQLCPAAINSFRQLITDKLTDERIAHWLGLRTTSSDSRLPLSEEITSEHFEAIWAEGCFDKHAQAKMSWFQPEHESFAMLFCNGQDIKVYSGLSKEDEREYLQAFCEFTVIDVNDEQFNQAQCTREIVRWMVEIDALAPLELGGEDGDDDFDEDEA